jgi:hypothetical protein
LDDGELERDQPDGGGRMTGLADELKSLPRRKTAPVIDEEIPREGYAGVVLREIDVSEGSLDYRFYGLPENVSPDLRLILRACFNFREFGLRSEIKWRDFIVCDALRDSRVAGPRVRSCRIVKFLDPRLSPPPAE